MLACKAKPYYVESAFVLAPNDYFEVRSDRRLANDQYGGFDAYLMIGASELIRSFGWRGLGEYTEVQDGTDWIYRYTIQASDVTIDHPTVRLSGIYANENNDGLGGVRYWLLKDIVTSRGSLQPGSLAAPQQMTVNSGQFF